MSETPTETIVLGDDKVRIEAGPRLVEKKATRELLSDRATASHYFPGAPDAKGKPIELDKMMSFLDWLADPVFYVFERVEIDPDDEVYNAAPPTILDPDAEVQNTHVYTYRFEERGTFATLEEAQAFAETLI